MGYGTLHTKSSRQKLNTKSSTEAELVGVSEYLPYNLWMNNFFKSQGYDLSKNVIYQDNQSAIRMEKNGRNSCTGNSRHINIRFFFIKNRIDDKEVQIEYCPTYIMLADYYTKALQGKLFTQLRDAIMGKISVFDLAETNTKLKERVGKYIGSYDKVSLDLSRKDHKCAPGAQGESSTLPTQSATSTKISYADAVRNM